MMSFNRTFSNSAGIAAILVTAAILIWLAPSGGGLMAEPKGIAGLPRAAGKSFVTLDAYLEHLKSLGAHDIPHYEKLPDGRYVQNLGRSASRTQTFYTREQLEKKFGFK